MTIAFSTKLVRKLRTSPLVQRVLTPFGSVPKPKRWIFVLGCYNSGTTLLAAVLGSHPEIAPLPQEGVFLTDALPPPERWRWSRMWCRCEAEMRLESGPGEADRARRIKRQWSLWLPRSPANVLEKSVANVVHIPFLAAHFQPAYFVYLVRDGYAVAEGLRRKARPWRWGRDEFPSGYPLSYCAEQWAASDALARRHLAGVERAITVTYEEFTADPAAISARIFDFLGLLPLDAAAFGRSWAVHDLDEPIRDMNAASHRRLSPADIAEIERVAGPVLVRNGYGRPVPD